MWISATKKSGVLQIFPENWPEASLYVHYPTNRPVQNLGTTGKTFWGSWIIPGFFSYDRIPTMALLWSGMVRKYLVLKMWMH